MTTTSVWWSFCWIARAILMAVDMDDLQYSGTAQSRRDAGATLLGASNARLRRFDPQSAQADFVAVGHSGATLAAGPDHQKHFDLLTLSLVQRSHGGDRDAAAHVAGARQARADAGV